MRQRDKEKQMKRVQEERWEDEQTEIKGRKQLKMYVFDTKFIDKTS